MCIFKQYKNLFGEPETGIHKTRFLGMAFWDLVMTAIAAIVIGFLTQTCYLKVFSVLFILGTIAHMLFGVDTAVIKYLREVGG